MIHRRPFRHFFGSVLLRAYFLTRVGTVIDDWLPEA